MHLYVYVCIILVYIDIYILKHHYVFINEGTVGPTYSLPASGIRKILQESSQNPMMMLNYMLDGYLVEFYTSVPTYKVCRQ